MKISPITTVFVDRFSLSQDMMKTQLKIQMMEISTDHSKINFPD